MQRYTNIKPVSARFFHCSELRSRPFDKSSPIRGLADFAELLTLIKTNYLVSESERQIILGGGGASGGDVDGGPEGAAHLDGLVHL
jgi:hypothetical protein